MNGLAQVVSNFHGWGAWLSCFVGKRSFPCRSFPAVMFAVYGVHVVSGVPWVNVNVLSKLDQAGGRGTGGEVLHRTVGGSIGLLKGTTIGAVSATLISRLAGRRVPIN